MTLTETLSNGKQRKRSMMKKMFLFHTKYARKEKKKKEKKSLAFKAEIIYDFLSWKLF